MEADPEMYPLGAVVPPPHFFGVHSPGIHFPRSTDPFSTDGWLDHCRQAASRLGIPHGKLLADPRAPRWKLAISNSLRALRSPAFGVQLLATGGTLNRHLLPVALMIRDVQMRAGRARVLDVGGGYGDNFFKLLPLLDRQSIGALEYFVVDNARSRELGNRLFASYAVRPRYLSAPTDLHSETDIVLMIGTLHYIPDWSAALTSLADRAKHYLYIARTPITSGERFVTVQLVCPTLGRMAGRNLGSTAVNVLDLHTLNASMPPGWNSMFEFRDVDCTAHFARLPAPNRDAAYLNLAWRRANVL